MPNTGVIFGGDMLFYVEVSAGTWTPVAHATSHTLSETAETITRKSKDTGKYPIRKVIGFDWTVKAEALKTYDGYGYHDLKTLYRAGLPIVVKMSGRTAGDGVTELEGDKYEQGTGVITSVESSNAQGEDETFSITIEAAGPLETKAVPTP